MDFGIELVNAYIAGIGESELRLRSTIHDLTDAQARQPSRLPEWTVGHVLTHLARNADSVVRRLDAVCRDEVADQYPGGAEGRAAEIEAGAGRPAAELVEDVTRSGDAALRACDAVPAGAWERLTRGVSGHESPAYAVVFSRWREVEVHHVDLGLGYTPDRWPELLVDAWLPRVVRELPERADARALLAWSVDRGPAPELASWG